MKKRMLAILMTIAMVGGVLPITSFAGEDSNFKDTKGHWASAQIDKWSGLGIVCGSDGYFRPDAPITRGEMAVILDKVMGYQKTGNNTFSDLDQNFYTDAVLKVNAAGVMVGDGDKLRPKDYISRQEAAVMLGRAGYCGKQWCKFFLC